jgi:hypothetical protein
MRERHPKKHKKGLFPFHVCALFLGLDQTSSVCYRWCNRIKEKGGKCNFLIPKVDKKLPERDHLKRRRKKTGINIKTYTRFGILSMHTYAYIYECLGLLSLYVEN